MLVAYPVRAEERQGGRDAAPVASGASPARSDSSDERAQPLEPPAPVPTVAPPLAEPGPPNYWRPAVEIAVGLGASIIWYLVDDRNVLDWDEPSAKERFTGDAWRFDNNGFGINFIAHPLTGGGYYVLARGNRMGVWSSWAYTVAGSTLWEIGIEFKEKVSVNDMIITPGGALPIGEFSHKLAWYLSSVQPRTPAKQAWAWTLGVLVHGHRKWDGLEPPPASDLDDLGYSTELWHDFGVSYGFGLTTPESGASSATQMVRGEGQLVSLPAYLTPRSTRTWFYNADVTSLSLEVDATRAGFGIDLDSETVLAGHHAQWMLEEERRDDFVALTAGVSVGYRYRRNKSFGFDDSLGLLHMPGLAADLRMPRGPIPLALSLRGSPSFGGLSVPSYQAWSGTRSEDERTKTVLEREGYMYGWGWTASAEVAVVLGALELGGEFDYGWYDSIEGLDRNQEELTNDSSIREVAWNYGAFAKLAPRSLPLEVGVRFNARRRRSRIEQTEVQSQGERVLIETAVRF